MINFDYYISIDPSITSTAVSIMSGDLSFIRSYFFTEKTKKFKNFSYENFRPFVCPSSWRKIGNDFYNNYLTNAIVQTISEYADNFNCRITLEGYSYSSKGLTFSIGEFVGLLKHKFSIIRNQNYIEVPPATVKKFILNGNSNKTDLMYTFLTKHIHKIRDINPNWCKELQTFIGDENMKFNLQKVNSPLSDILDSVYIGLWSIQEVKNANNVQNRS